MPHHVELSCFKRVDSIYIYTKTVGEGHQTKRYKKV